MSGETAPLHADLREDHRFATGWAKERLSLRAKALRALCTSSVREI